MHRLTALVVALLLTGCAGELGRAPGQTGAALAGPPGYCPLDGTRRDQGGTVFVAFSRCAPGGGGQADGPDAVLTASLGAAGSAQGADLSPVALRGFFTGRDGRATLSRTGTPEAVVLHDISTVEDTVILRLTDRSRNLPEAIAQGESWRAVLSAGGRLVTLTVQSRREAPLTTEQGRALIRAFARAVRNRATG